MLHAATLLFLEQLRTPLLNEAAVAVTAFGSPFVALLLVYTLYHFDHRDTAVLAFTALAAGGVVEKTLNLLVRRPRPDIVSAVITGYPQGFAFPSGHATVAFALAAVLEQELDGSNYYFYVLAALVAVSRLYLGLHWPGDVVAGAVLGTAAGLLVHRYRGRVLAAADPLV
ncbi:MAG: phosphatase PAP2 family protein [Candidatus Nanohaloarchaea archaeon]|nr:phosphatase PAP2 family protein [Candidatus Nanohaloarchaea archaeon]